MTDFHSHILPGIDDGARNAGESRTILAGLRSCGFDRIALTPHFYPAKDNIPRFLSAREKAFESLTALPEAASFSFLRGAEVFLTESLFHFEDFRALCFEGTDLMMVEPSEREEMTAAFLNRLERIVSSYGITPVIAHIDRFPYLFRDRRALDRLRETGCLFQLNLSSMFEWGKKGRAARLIRNGYVDFVGNDLHRPIPDPARFKCRLEKFRGRTGEEAFDQIEENARSLFSESR